MQHEESIIQQNCKRWFNLQYPKIARLLFAVPNGGRRGKLEAKIMKGEGVEAGVADMILLLPSPTLGYSSLCIEFKTAKGRQSANQKTWQKITTQYGNAYSVVRDVNEFVELIKLYLAKTMSEYDKERIQQLERERDLYISLGCKRTANARQRLIDELKNKE